jgi:hypothetical protein
MSRVIFPRMTTVSNTQLEAKMFEYFRLLKRAAKS